MGDAKFGGLSGGAAVAIVPLGIVAIVWLTTIVIDTYDTAGDAVSVVSVVVGPLAGVAAAAFGMKLSIDAKNETKEVKQEAGAVADDVRNVVAEMGGQRGLTDAGLSAADMLTQVEQRLRRLTR